MEGSRPEAMALRGLLAASPSGIGSMASWPSMAGAQSGRLRLRPRRQSGPAHPGRRSGRGRRHGPCGRRGGLLRSWPGRKPDQGVQAPPRLGPHLLHQGDGQPVPPADPHRRLLAPAHPARPGAADLVLARRPVRHPAPRLREGRRPGYRAGHPHQGRAAVKLPRQGELRPLRRPRPCLAALIRRAACPHRALPHNPKPRSPAPPAPPSGTPTRSPIAAPSGVRAGAHE